MGLRLRQYKPCDADNIVSWIKDEDALRKWSSDRFGDYPISAEDINNKYLENNGDCKEEDNFYPLTAFDESGVVCHLILRYTDEEKKVIRFGFVIVDDSKRGKGYGKQMLTLAMRNSQKQEARRADSEWCMAKKKAKFEFYGQDDTRTQVD